MARLVAEIRATRPDFVLNNLIGASSYAFIKAYAELGREDPHFRRNAARCCPATSPNASCRRSARRAIGHLSAGTVFSESGTHGGNFEKALPLTPPAKGRGRAGASQTRLVRQCCRGPLLGGG